MASAKTIVGRILWTLYWWVCIGYWIAFFYAAFALRSPFRVINAVIKAFWLPTNDAVLNFLIAAVAVIVGLILVPGILLVGFCLFVAAMVVGFAAWLVQLLISLAHVSLTGAIVAGIIAAFAFFWVIRLLWGFARPYLGRVAEALFGVFFDWWVYPLWLDWKGRRLMGKTQTKKAELVQEYQELQVKFPEIAGLPLTGSYDGWASQAYQRFQSRQVGKTLAQQAKTVEAQKNVLERVKQLYTEFAAATDAYDDVKNLETHFREKREEEEIRRHDRKKRLLTLKKEIKDLKSTPKPAAAALPREPPRDRVKEEVDRIAAEIGTATALEAAEEEMVRKNPKQEVEIRRAFRKRKEDLREAW